MLPFRREQTHGILERHGVEVFASSDTTGWKSLYASEQIEMPYEGHFKAVDDQLIVLHMDGPVHLDIFSQGRANRRVVPAGSIHLYPGGVDFDIRLLNRSRTLHVYLRRTILEEVARKIVRTSANEVLVPPRLVDSDAAFAGLLQAVRPAMGALDAAAMLYGDHLARVIACHLIRNYSTAALRRKYLTRGNGRASGDIVADIIGFMQENLDKAVTLRRISEAFGIGSAMVTRLFREVTGKPPHQYLMGLRAERARTMVIGSADSITSIALECGYANQEHMARQYKKAFGLTPTADRQLHAAPPAD